MSEFASKSYRCRALAGKSIRVDASDRGVCRIEIRDPSESTQPPLEARRREGRARDLVERTIAELDAYLAGRLKKFLTPVDLEQEGTPFQRRVWKRLLEIPFGAIETYGDVAEAVGSPKGVRAVGQAVGRNPVPIIVPCHRVIGSDRRLTGFGCGLPVKVRLLEIEGVELGPEVDSIARRRVLLEV